MFRVVTLLALLTISACAVLPNQSTRPEDWFQQGVSLLQSGQYDRAIEAFSQALELDPQYSEAYLNRGLAWAGKGEFTQAIANYTKALELNPRESNAYLHRGVAWARKGDLDRAIADYTKALELTPKDGRAYYHRGAAWAEKGDLDRGLSDAAKALELEPNNKAYVGLVTALQARMATGAEGRVQQGVSLLQAGQYDKAIEAFSKALELDPHYGEAYMNRGLAWAGKGELDQAIADGLL